MTEEQLIKKSKKNNRQAQTELYLLYSRYWFSICLRYVKERNDASDILQESIIKIFTKLSQFDENKGEFKSWSARVVVNENLMFLRKKDSSFRTDEIREDLVIFDNGESAIEKLEAEELTIMISTLPVGYRSVFNLYVVDGFNHREIAIMLGISEGTSKSQLFKAKNILKRKLEVVI